MKGYMTEKEFCYWLNGFFEISGAKTLNSEQIAMIKEHLAAVFEKETSTLEELGTLTTEFENFERDKGLYC